MTGSGFYEQKSFSPTGLGIVLALHAAALGAAVVMKGPQFIRELPVRMKMIDIAIPPDPPPVPPPPASRVDQPQTQLSRLDTAIPIINVPVEHTIVTGPPVPPPPIPGPIGNATIGSGGAAPVLPPMRIDAEFDPRFAGAMQPPYPTSEERAQREGLVRLRVTIGADGRVKAVERLTATSDAFWRATERHARSRWRFRPATVDGRPVESSKVLNIHFRIEV